MKEQLLSAFKSAFGDANDVVIVRSPGRVNIIGEHTDYNDGFVLPAAINKAAYIAIRLRDDDRIILYAKDMDDRFEINLNDLAPVASVDWPNYILGAVAQFAKKDIPLRGFEAVLSSDVPIGAGLSSSAAVECATSFALNEVLQAGLDRVTLVKMSQKAEHEYAGVMCGIMDQFASVMGKKNHVIRLDCRSLEYEYVPFRLDGIRILLLNTNVKHSLASSEYNTRRQECAQAVEWVKEKHPEVLSLRDVTEEMLDELVLPRDPLIDQRSRFVVKEIARLLSACEDMKNGDLSSLGQRMYETHDGLSKAYSVSCKELDFLVDFVRPMDAVIGARMMGGGFGGCTINLAREEAIDDIIAKIKPAYESAMNLPLTWYVADIEDGTDLCND